MPRPTQRALHPLLLERDYWRRRLRALRASFPGLVLIPRPELCTNAIEVEEFRVRAHDGLRLWGLRARSRFGARSARVRVVGPSELPEIDRRAVQEGVVEFVLQEPAGRRLEDRVLDVIRIHQLAQGCGLAPGQVELARTGSREAPDEFLIASQLLADGPESPDVDETAGWSLSDEPRDL